MEGGVGYAVMMSRVGVTGWKEVSEWDTDV